MITDTSPKYSGEPTAKSLATGLATLGRYGDNYMVHAKEGETVVPMEILEANPELKANLFRQMTMMGIKNPNRYVVGNELNSINPVTGQPEFFFKKVFSAIKKVAKKVLPVAVPAISNYLLPGSGPFASALFTKTQGGSWGDAAKAGALSYVSSAIGRGLQSSFSLDPATNVPGSGGPFDFLDRVNFNPENFGTGFQSGLTEPFSATKGLFTTSFSDPANPIQQGGFGPKGIFGTNEIGLFPKYQSQSGPFTRGAGIDPENLSRLQGVQSRSFAPITPSGAIGRSQIPRVFDSQLSDDAFRQGTQRSFMPITPGEEGSGLRGIYSTTKAVPPPSSIEKAVTSSVQDVAKEATEKGFLNQLGQFVSGDRLEGIPATLAGAGVAGTAAYLAADALMPEEEAFDESTLRTNIEKNAYNQWQNIADKNSPEAESLRTVWYGKPRYSATQLASSFGANPLSGITARAAGGEIMGPGTGTSDSIPAMLSDGEFVMTAKAVRNAGNGDRDVGAARMYDMMNRFESGAA